MSSTWPTAATSCLRSSTCWACMACDVEGSVGVSVGGRLEVRFGVS
jgi:hypothetical protein